MDLGLCGAAGAFGRISQFVYGDLDIGGRSSGEGEHGAGDGIVCDRLLNHTVFGHDYAVCSDARGDNKRVGRAVAGVGPREERTGSDALQSPAVAVVDPGAITLAV